MTISLNGETSREITDVTKLGIFRKGYLEYLEGRIHVITNFLSVPMLLFR